ncbi:MAG: septum formation initiator family protein [Johnsonella sp.]|nr:septum formation initiator family protein [Johnsonella sp.]
MMRKSRRDERRHEREYYGNDRSYRNNPYIVGNTVRKYAPEPEWEHRERTTQSIRYKNRNLRRNQERAAQMDLPYLMFLVAAIVFSLYFFYSYLSIQNSITASMREVEKKQKQLAELRNENDALEMSINAHVDLDNIYKLATEDLGMVYAGSDQIIIYDKVEREQVRQYEEVPRQ